MVKKKKRDNMKLLLVGKFCFMRLKFYVVIDYWGSWVIFFIFRVVVFGYEYDVVGFCF